MRKMEDRGWKLARAGVMLISVVAGFLVAGPSVALAQGGTPTTTQDAAKALKDLQSQLDLARKERLALEARLEKELADEMAARAKGLSMGTEVDALQRLERMLDSAQARLLIQRDRIRLLKDEAQATDRAVLVVLVRADTLPEGGVSAVLTLDGAMIKKQTYMAEKAKAIAAGAADELYRADMPPVEHTVLVQIAGTGLNVGDTVTVAAVPGKVTYVEFALKGGKLVTAKWTN
ncbi:MAG: hypothetical protein ACHQQR_14925 [Gemmatimonadales bacterium]